MGLVNKLKNILFEEEEVEIPVLEKKENKVMPEATYKEKPVEEVKQTPDYSSYYQDMKESIETERMQEEKNRVLESNMSQPIPQEEKKSVVETEENRELFKSDHTFHFPAFDEEEFESALPRRTTNILEHERKKEAKKKNYQVPVKQEEVHEVKKFRPSPIISPVYGILDKNYTPDEITTRENNLGAQSLDVDSVRKKAFGSFEESVPPKKEEEELNLIEDKILEEKLEKARTIDELLKDSSDCEIELPPSTFSEEEEVSDVIDSLEEEVGAKEEKQEDDTLESDLFDLIDSMYENREDGE